MTVKLIFYQERHQSIALEVVEFKDEKIPIGTSKILKGNFEVSKYSFLSKDSFIKLNKVIKYKRFHCF